MAPAPAMNRPAFFSLPSSTGSEASAHRAAGRPSQPARRAQQRAIVSNRDYSLRLEDGQLLEVERRDRFR